MGTKQLPLLLSALLMLILFSIFVNEPHNVAPAGSDAKKPDNEPTTEHKFMLPTVPNPFHDVTNVLNPFRAPVHAPPRQKNDTDGESSWWSDWKWLVPFSSSLTLDEDRSLLPPLKPRPPIYCYYDTTTKKDSATKDAESALLLTWRRAWWAKGFLPVILSAAEATNNPLYDQLQRLTMDPAVKTQLTRWIAWDTMDGGILAEYTLLPMGQAEDPLLVYLRNGEYSKMTRYSGLDSGLLVGPQADLTKTIKATLESKQLDSAKDVFHAAPSNLFVTDEGSQAIAYYDVAVIQDKYNEISKVMATDKADGLRKLNELINSHLHQTWQGIFSKGLVVLQPKPEHTGFIVKNAVSIANDLVTCSPTPLSTGSCPPNMPECVQCSDSTRMKLTTGEFIVNSTSLYTIGTVPHPYTFVSMVHITNAIDTKWILKEMTVRDPWLTKITENIFAKPASRNAMLMRFKEAVAGEYAPSHSLWMSAEKDAPADINWHFGFAIPQAKSETLKNVKVPSLPVLAHDAQHKAKVKRAGDEKDEKKAKTANSPEKSNSDSTDLIREATLLQKALSIGNSRDANDVKIRNALEAWNLADLEAWKFARAFLARRIVERQQWETEESKYVQGLGTEQGRRTRWWDNIEDKIAGVGGKTSDTKDGLNKAE
ncbi:hypothetical protein Cpir12675_005183 [Ceratocystis pirilliformis]|uniref:Uncharacterized protein n=1 Tax=Ceratocystis pirilliformis TaxID=259994 RepID=A0ABR3YSQ3_9PEZI